MSLLEIPTEIKYLISLFLKSSKEQFKFMFCVNKQLGKEFIQRRNKVLLSKIVPCFTISPKSLKIYFLNKISVMTDNDLEIFKNLRFGTPIEVLYLVFSSKELNQKISDIIKDKNIETKKLVIIICSDRLDFEIPDTVRFLKLEVHNRYVGLHSFNVNPNDYYYTIRSKNQRMLKNITFFGYTTKTLKIERIKTVKVKFSSQYLIEEKALNEVSDYLIRKNSQIVLNNNQIFNSRIRKPIQDIKLKQKIIDLSCETVLLFRIVPCIDRYFLCVSYMFEILKLLSNTRNERIHLIILVKDLQVFNEKLIQLNNINTNTFIFETKYQNTIEKNLKNKFLLTDTKSLKELLVRNSSFCYFVNCTKDQNQPLFLNDFIVVLRYSGFLCNKKKIKYKFKNMIVRTLVIDSYVELEKIVIKGSDIFDIIIKCAYNENLKIFLKVQNKPSIRLMFYNKQHLFNNLDQKSLIEKFVSLKTL